MKPSRGMIFAEISWAYIAIAFAWSGAGFWPFDNSYLNRVLERHEWEWLWLIFMGLPAVVLMLASMREHVLHKKGGLQFNLLALDESAKIRGRLSLALAFSWMYALYVLIYVQRGPSALMLIALGGIFFMLFAWGENRRVQRDVRKQTGSFAAPTSH